MNTKVFKENLIKALLFFCAISSIGIVFFIIFFLLNSGYPAVIQWFSHGFNSIQGCYIIELTYDSLYLALGGTLLAIIIGLPCAIYLAEFADNRLRNIVKPALEVLNGFPSIVIGIIGFTVLCLNLPSFGFRASYSTLVGWIVLGIMSLPVITSVSEDSLRAVPDEMREASLGLGATRWQTTTQVLLSSASPGIITAIVLGFASAIGETMAVIWVIGGAMPPPLTLNPLVRTYSITAWIANVATGDTFQPGTILYQQVFGAGVILFGINAFVVLAIRRISSSRSKTNLGIAEKSKK